MISNVKLKVFLQDKIFPVFSIINEFVTHNDKIIMLYTNMGIRDNVGALLDYIIKCGLNKEYKIICSTNDLKNYTQTSILNVKYVSNLKGFLYFFRAGFVFYCFGKIPIRPGKQQKVVQMWHGTCFKGGDEGQIKGHSLKNQYYTHFLSTSEYLKPIWKKNFSLEDSRLYVTGQPRNDALFSGVHYDFGDYDKIVIWMPTFRKSNILGYENAKSDEILSILPKEKFEEFNRYLEERNIKVVVKLHPLQDLSHYNLVNMNYFILLSHNEFTRREMDLYSFIGQCDALITDYSSVFVDYLLLDRPIGFTIDDIDEYKNNRGFVFKNPLDYMPGHHMQTTNDLYQFIDDLYRNEDNYVAQRKKVNALFNDYTDNQSCKRLLNTVGISL